MAFAIAALGATAPVDHPGRRRGRRLVSGVLRDARVAPWLKADKLYSRRFMGAGKSHGRPRVAPAPWAGALLDIDEWIEQRERQPIADIFATAARRLLPGHRARGRARRACPERHVVVATGGGTLRRPRQPRGHARRRHGRLARRRRSRPSSTRVPSDGRRPLAADRDAVRGRFTSTRRATYRLAHVRIDATAAAVDELVERILDRLGW